jgi:cellulose synthase/poly-beta-1,6-N-acetylglucosamine synthase-like glycosyltransferase
VWEWSLAAGFAFHLGVFLSFYLYSGNYARISFPDRAVGIAPDFGSRTADPPGVSMIIPVTGNAKGMIEALQSLVKQDYPNLEVIFVTRDPNEPAAELVRMLQAGRPEVRHVTAGKAKACGQKNHNLLAGVAASNPVSEILVFCDGTHRARPDFLGHLVSPLVRGEESLSCGFHRILPGSSSLSVLGMLFAVLFIHLLHPIQCITQPWGGATAVKRKPFEQYGVREVWAENILDDFPLGLTLMRHGIRCYPVSLACLETPLDRLSMGELQGWWQRQIHYLKFCMPWTWAATSLAILFVLGAPAAAVVSVLAWPFGLFPAWLGGAALLFLVLLSVVGAAYRSLVPAQIPLLPWLGAFYGLMFLSAWCYLRTVPSNVLTWRDISYRVGWGGKVREILHDSQAHG